MSEKGNLNKISISRIRREVDDPFYLSNDLVITYITNMRNPTRDYPTTVEGFTALIMMHGEATLSIDTETHKVVPNTLVFINATSVVKTLECTEEAGAYLLTFSQSFIKDVQIDISTSMPVYMRFGKSPCLKLTEDDVAEIRQLFGFMKTILRSDKGTYKKEIIRTLFTAVFYMISDISAREKPVDVKPGRSELIFEQFVNLLRKHHTQERNVSFYAQQMSITPKYLSSVIKEVSGRSAAKWIDEYVILEAKTLLKYSGLSVQEIAYKLNFSTQSFFGKYFKQHTGISPSRYKRQPN